MTARKTADNIRLITVVRNCRSGLQSVCIRSQVHQGGSPACYHFFSSIKGKIRKCMGEPAASREELAYRSEAAGSPKFGRWLYSSRLFTTGMREKIPAVLCASLADQERATSQIVHLRNCPFLTWTATSPYRPCNFVQHRLATSLQYAGGGTERENGLVVVPPP